VFSEVVFFNQQNRQASADSVACNTRSVDTATDHHKIKVGV